MNYRHAYHAGNFADVVKHALLVHLLKDLAKKDAAFFVLDTHAGPGLYDLSSPEAIKTGEWRDGVGRLVHPDGVTSKDLPPSLRDFIQTVRTLGAPRLYPGSPSIIASLLRQNDRLICTELHPADAASLAKLFSGQKHVSVHHQDGYQAIKAFLPVKHIRRGLVLIDPPFEEAGEFDRLRSAIGLAKQRMPTSRVAAWYPIKHRAPIRAFHDQLKTSGLQNLLACELTLRAPIDASRLNGCGLLIANPPWQFDDLAAETLKSLVVGLKSDSDIQASVNWLVKE